MAYYYWGVRPNNKTTGTASGGALLHLKGEACRPLRTVKATP